MYPITFLNTSKQFAYGAREFPLLINFGIITKAYDKKISTQ